MAATAALIAILIGGYALMQGDDQSGRQGPTVAAGTQIAADATRTNTAEQTETVVSNATVVQGKILPTAQPTLPTNVRASDDTPTQTSVPTQEPTSTDVPTREPTETAEPSATVTVEPSATREPTSTSTHEPTATAEPTDEPTATRTATLEPTATHTPTEEPTATATATAEPTATHTPTEEPTATYTPTDEPTATETETPEPTATERPRAKPTKEPTATEETGPPTIAPADDSGPSEEDSPTATAGSDDTTLILPVETPGEGSAGETPTDEAVGGPTDEASGDETSNTVAPLDDTARMTGISSGGAPIGPLRINSPQSLMVLSSDAGGSDLQVVTLGDGSIVASLGAGANPIWSPMGLVLLYQQYSGNAPAVAIYDAETGEILTISDPSAEGAVQDIPAGWNGSSAYYLREMGDEASTVTLNAYDVNTGETAEVWRSEGVALSPGRPIATGNGFLIATGQSWLLVGMDGSEMNLGPNDYGLSGEGFLSPFGSLVAYPANGQIVVAGVDSPGIPAGVIPYVEGPGAGFTWAPDGEFIAVSDGFSIQVYDETGNFIGAATSDNGVTIAAPQWLDDGIYYVETAPTPSLRRLRLSKIPGFSE